MKIHILDLYNIKIHIYVTTNAILYICKVLTIPKVCFISFYLSALNVSEVVNEHKEKDQQIRVRMINMNNLCSRFGLSKNPRLVQFGKR